MPVSIVAYRGIISSLNAAGLLYPHWFNIAQLRAESILQDWPAAEQTINEFLTNNHSYNANFLNRYASYLLY